MSETRTLTRLDPISLRAIRLHAKNLCLRAVVFGDW